jgi:hypothetical protein
MVGAYTWHTLGRACVGLGLASPPLFPSPWARHTPTPFLEPLFPHRARQTPTLLQPPSLTGHGQVAGISRVWGVVPYSPVFPPLHPVTTPFLLGPSHAHPSFTTPFLSAWARNCPDPFATLRARVHVPSAATYLTLLRTICDCVWVDLSPPWTHT